MSHGAEPGGQLEASHTQARMHDGQVDVDVATVAALIARQFPEWSGLPVRPAPSSGTVNAIFRVGDGLAARLPLVVDDPQTADAVMRREADAAREFALVTRFPAPMTTAMGAPGAGYPGPWCITTWIEGEPATPDALAHSPEFAGDIAALIRELRAAPVGGRSFQGRGRGGDLRDHDEWMATCIRQSEGLLAVDQLAATWAAFRELPRDAPNVMSHTDLIPANLLVSTGRLAGVLDVGGFQPADPARDLVAAWHLFEEPARGELRAALRDGIRPDGDEELEWARGAAWAFEQAMGLVWYYRNSNPAMSALGRSTLRRILASGIVSRL